MKQIKTKSGEILIVEVPEDTTWWSIIENKLGDFTTKELDLPQQFLQYGKSSIIFGKQVNNQVYYNPNSFYLPKGKWKIVGKLSELTDKDCEEFVEWDDCSDDFDPNILKICYKNYIGNGEFEDSLENWNISTAKESFISLLQSEGINTSNEDKLLIIKLL
jgi:hypothetical protein